MTCNLNSNYSGLSFGSIQCVSGGEQLIKKTFNKAQRAELRKLIEAQKDNPVKIILAQHTDKRLCGWTVFTEQTNGTCHRKDYTQRILFDSPLKFIKRLCDNADKLKEKYAGDIQEVGGKEFDLNM